MSRPGEKQQVPVIIRRRKGGLHDHDDHNVAWKMAFADFMTAMMAMFLLLWLVSITSEEQKEGLSDFFNPISVSQANSGGNGMLAGKSVDRQGALTSPFAPQEKAQPVSSPPVETEIADQERAPNVGDDLTVPKPDGLDSDSVSEPPSNEKIFGGEDLANFEEGGDGDEVQQGNGKVFGGDDISNFNEGTDEVEDERMRMLKERILNAFRATPELQDVFSSLLFEETPEGMRIQVTDSPHFSMFKTGSAEMNEQALRLMRLMGDTLQRVPNKLSISGHTDSDTFKGRPDYSNWELSTDRANSARRQLTAAGIDGKRFERVLGAADNDPLIRTDPLDPRNRRISITVLRTTPLPADLLPSLTDKYRL